MNEIQSLVALMRVPHLGAVRIRQLLDRFGSASAALQASEEEIRSIEGIGPRIAEGWSTPGLLEEAERELELAGQHGIDLISYKDERYPDSLNVLSDAPVLLYVKGELRKEDERSIAVIGTRGASIYGNEQAYQISRELAGGGYTVVSGLARGIDTAAHCGALESGRTIAVIGSGLLRLYPQENHTLAERIASNGALISEYSLFTPPDRQNFPQRNRVVSALSRGTFLVEAPVKSGAMNTVSRTLRQKKPVFVLPGRVDQESFRGNHALLREQKGRLVENGREIMGHFNDLFTIVAQENKVAALPPSFQGDELAVMNALQQGELGVDAITQITQLAPSKVNIILMRLLLKKAVKEYPGKIYKKAC